MDWCSISTDDRGRPVSDPTLINRVELREFPFIPADIETLMGSGELSLDDAVSTFVFYNGSNLCTIPMSGFRDAYGVQLDPATYILGNGRTWLAYSQFNDTVPSFDPVASVFIIAGFTNITDAALTDSTSDWGFTADLLSLEHMGTLADGGDYTLDWSALTTDVLGNSFDRNIADRLFIAQTSDDLVSLQQSLLALENDADAFYRMTVGGAISANLMDAEMADGTSFGGFTEDGLWLIGLECSTCMHPAPLTVAVIDVEAATTE